MGRRHLSLVAALAVAVALAAPATAGPRWRVLDRGNVVGPALSVPVAFVALDRASSKRFAYRLPASGKNALARLDFGRNAVVAVFSQFGCIDHRVAVRTVTQRGDTLVVSLVERPLAPGTMECQATYPVYRLLAVPKASLARPYPTRSEARLS